MNQNNEIEIEKSFIILINKFNAEYKLFKIEENKNEVFYIKKLRYNKLFCFSKTNFKEICYAYFLKIAKTQKVNAFKLSQHLKTITLDEFNKSIDRFHSYLENEGLINYILNIKFKPILKEYINVDYGIYLNNYEPTKYLSNNNLIKKNDFPNIKELILNLCNGDVKSYDRFIKILAHSLQKPEEKWQGYVVLQGDGASGKGTFFELILEPLFEKYFIVGTKEEIFSKQFNSHSVEKLWIAVEEFKGDNQKDDLSNTIKALTGKSKQFKELKGVDKVEIEDYARYIITTNEHNPKLKLKSHDRRANIFGYSRALGGSQEEASKKRQIYNKKIPCELESFAKYLHELKFDYAEIFQSFQNERFKELLVLDLSNTGHFIHELNEKLNNEINAKEIYLKDLIEENYYHFDVAEFNRCKYITCQSIYEQFKSYCIENRKNIASVNNFWAEFYQITNINKSIYKGKNRVKHISLLDFNNYFKSKYSNEEEKEQ